VGRSRKFLFFCDFRFLVYVFVRYLSIFKIYHVVLVGNLVKSGLIQIHYLRLKNVATRYLVEIKLL